MADTDTLLAKQAITEVIYRYCRALDRMDRPLADTISDTAAWLGGKWRPDAWQHVLSVERERRLVAVQADRG